MNATELDITEYDAWNDLVDRSAEGSLFSKTWYLDALGAQYRILVVRDKEALKGGMVLTTDRWGYSINPVFCKYLGVVFHPFEGHPYRIETQRREVQRSLLTALAKERFFEYTFHPSYDNWLPFYEDGYLQSCQYTYRIDLAESAAETALLEKMASRLRNKIQKAMRESEVVVEETADVESVLPLLAGTYEKQGMNPPLPQGRLSHLITVLIDQKAILLLRAIRPATGEILAVLGLFTDRHTAYLVLNSTNDQISDRGINEMLIYKGMVKAMEAGLKTFDFEGSMLPNIESFYRTFGGKATPYFRIWKPGVVRTLRQWKQRWR